jgi:murein L,D-transpeptidase YcbB/YkuD
MAAKHRRIVVPVLCAALFLGLLLPPKRAAAQTFMDLLFGAQPYNRYYERRYRDRRYQYRRPRDRWHGNRPRTPRIRIEAPRYYQYAPEQMSLYSMARLAQALTSHDLPEDKRNKPLVLAREHISAAEVRTSQSIYEALIAHYKELPDFIWVANGMQTEKARSAIDVLTSASDYGLNVEDYAIKTQFLSAEDPSIQDLVQFEIEMSAAVLMYALDSMRGRVIPNRISGYHDLPRKSVDPEELLKSIMKTSDVASFLAHLHPNNEAYRSLLSELARLRSRDPDSEIRIDKGAFVRPGGASAEMPDIIAGLRRRASESLKRRHAEILSAYNGTEEYSPGLVALVRDFQRESGLQVDGIIGRNTIASIVSLGNNDKVTKIHLALERLRWLPQNLGQRYVFINQPAFTATYVEAGRQPLSMKAVVGKKSNQTSFFVDEIETVEYNPYWGVPLSIIVNEMLPKLSRDPSYLDRLGYEVSTVSGRRVSSYNVDWYAVAKKQSQINVRQPPGPKNALGAVKIVFPNKHHIYMHDTPHKSLFGEKRRAFSHGCVRLERPREMAAAVLRKSRSYIDDRVAARRNEREDLRVPIPVYVAYFTAWPDLDGGVRYSDDIYERDHYLSLAVKRTEASRAPLTD